MSTLSVVLLIVIALASVGQTWFLLRVALEGRKTVRGLEGFAERLFYQLRPTLSELNRATSNVAAVSDIANAQAQRLDAVVGDAADALVRTGARLHEAIIPTLGRMAIAASAFRLARRVVAIYRRLRR